VVRKRPCRICGRWFQPEGRAGDRQHVCGRDECQRERHRRACAAWRAREADAERAERVRRRVEVALGDERAGDTGPERAPPGLEARVRWDAVRDAVGVEVLVVLQVMARVLGESMRDAVRLQVSEVTRQSRRVVPTG